MPQLQFSKSQCTFQVMRVVPIVGSVPSGVAFCGGFCGAVKGCNAFVMAKNGTVCYLMDR